MKAVRLHGQAGIDGLTYEDAPDAAPSVGDVLVKVHAAGITPTELSWPIWTDQLGHTRAYIIPGHEFSGVIVGLGWGTAGLAVGDEVYGLISAYRDGAAAELIAIEARDVAPKPSTIDHVHAAAIPQAGLTSWQALFEHGHLTSGQWVVIHGAGGGLGAVAVQLACWAGAHIVATGHGSARSTALELGAERFVDLDHDHWEDEIGQVDLVYDTIGGEVLDRSASVVRPGGALVTVVGYPTRIRDGIRTVSFVRESSREQLKELAKLVDGGKLRAQVGAVYPLAETKRAFADKEGGRVKGKVILEP